MATQINGLRNDFFMRGLSLRSSQMCQPSRCEWGNLNHERSTHDSWVYQRPHLFAALYHYYKASFWGLKFILDQTTQFIQQDFWSTYLIYPPIYKNVICNFLGTIVSFLMKSISTMGYSRFRVDLRFSFLI